MKATGRKRWRKNAQI